MHSRSRSRSNSFTNTSLNNSNSFLPDYWSRANHLEDVNISVDLEDLKLKYNNDLSSLKSNFNQTHHDEFKLDDKFLTNMYKRAYKKPISSENLTVSFPQSTRKLITRLDLIKQDNENIRKKYQHPSYEYQGLMPEKSGTRRPYEELYLENRNLISFFCYIFFFH